MVTGLASDRLACLSELGKLRMFNSIALLGSGLFFILLSVIPPAGGIADVILISEFSPMPVIFDKKLSYCSNSCRTPRVLVRWLPEVRGDGVTTAFALCYVYCSGQC